ncbi:hypothetical protein GCM10009623_28040 [Nocardioides aestuarii]|uniref:Fibronectin type-III domain-containing protein n=1 Tax=Nocardioides aestuarii TaxID=252231 RepID=A0ABW4TQE8_9ACTN
MNPRIPFVAAVVGALLVGGATTGGTHASWSSQRQLAGHSVSSGQMSYTATTPGGVTVSRVAGATADTTLVLDDTSVGKKLGQRITATVGSTPTGVTATVGTACPGTSTVSVDTTPTSADQTLCVRVTSSTTAVSGNVNLTLSSAQRPTAGWTTPAITRTIAVTVATQPLTCSAQSVKDVRSFTWEPVSGATGYTVTVSGSQTGSYSTTATYGSTTTQHQVTLTSPAVRYFRVTAATAAGPTEVPGALRMERVSNNGNSNMLCEVVTP